MRIFPSSTRRGGVSRRDARDRDAEAHTADEEVESVREP